jgi:hypothetical protein
MHMMTSLAAAGLISLAAFATATAAGVAPAAPSAAAAPDAATVKAAQELMAAMQAEKLVRMVAGSSRFPNEQARNAAMAKVERLTATPAEVYKRLSAPVARLVSAETAAEMARFYQSPYGQKVLHQKYNSRASLGGESAPQASREEKAALKKAAYIKASKEFDMAEPAIRHEVFVLIKSVLAAA